MVLQAKPRILILSTAYLPLIGGSELAIHHLAQRMTEFDFDLVTTRHDDSSLVMEQVGHVRVFRAGGRFSRFALGVPKVLAPVAMAVTAYRLARTHRYQVLHAYQASQAGGAAWLIKLLCPRLPLVVTLQEGKDLDKQSAPTRLLRALILRHADRITAISAHLAAYARRFSSAPVDIIANGVDVAAHASGLSERGNTLVTVSRLVEKNNIAVLLRAFAEVRRGVSDASLTVVGDGPLRGELEALSADLGVAHAVRWVGTAPHDELAPHLHCASVFVRPSLTEGLGSAFLEAMAAGCAVVASPVGGIPDIVRHGETGLLCDPRDPAAIARSVVMLLSDDALRARITAKASAMVRERYPWDSIARQMAGVYNELAS
jgi:glycosyltransferase involved in cell wall biosynthesis